MERSRQHPKLGPQPEAATGSGAQRPLMGAPSPPKPGLSRQPGRGMFPLRRVAGRPPPTSLAGSQCADSGPECGAGHWQAPWSPQRRSLCVECETARARAGRRPGLRCCHCAAAGGHPATRGPTRPRKRQCPASLVPLAGHWQWPRAATPSVTRSQRQPRPPGPGRPAGLELGRLPWSDARSRAAMALSSSGQQCHHLGTALATDQA
jgi:hypothetical protein